MNHLYLTALLYLAAVLQMGHVFEFSGSFANPAWVWLVLVAAVRRVEGSALLIWGAGVGLCADCVSASPLGLQLICGVIFAGWMSKSSAELSHPRPVFVAALTGIVTFLAATIVLAWTLFASGSPVVTPDQLQAYFAPALSTAAAAFVLELTRAAGTRLMRFIPGSIHAVYSTR